MRTPLMEACLYDVGRTRKDLKWKVVFVNNKFCLLKYNFPGIHLLVVLDNKIYKESESMHLLLECLVDVYIVTIMLFCDLKR